MIKYRHGRKFFETEAEVLCNPVNCVGVYGAGLAKEFAKRYPKDVATHRRFAQTGAIKPGETLPTFDSPPTIILHCATKDDWRFPSTYGFIEGILHSINANFCDLNFKSIAIPALGCANGGLSWNVVKPMMEEILEHECFQVFAYMPL